MMLILLNDDASASRWQAFAAKLLKEATSVVGAS
jgi:hypothetical protein